MRATKIRLVRNIVTTIIGSLLLLAATGLWVASKFANVEFEFSFIQLLPAVLLGWVLLMAKDSLLEGITMGIFKLKSKD